MKWGYGLAILLCLAGSLLQSQAQTVSPPTDLTATVEPGRHPEIVLGWQAPVTSSTSLYYTIYRAVDTLHFSFRDAVRMPGFEDHQVKAGHMYSYFVKAVEVDSDSRVSSAPSDTVSARVPLESELPHGTIAGTVTDSMSGAPLASVRISFFKISSDDEEGWGSNTFTDTAGKYSALLDTGMYLVKAQAMPVFPPMMMPFPFWWTSPIVKYFPEWFDDSPTADLATPITVSDSSQFTADFDLQRILPPVLASVSGMVSDTAGNPIKGALVVFVRSIQHTAQLMALNGDMPMDGDDMDIDDVGHLHGILARGFTDSSGHYSVKVAENHSYIAAAFKKGFLPQWFNGMDDPRNADTLFITGDTTGIDFSLTPKAAVVPNSISGVVKDSLGTRVPSRILLIPAALTHERHAMRFGLTDSTGAYMISKVRAGQYFVFAIPFATYAPAFYKAGAFGVIQIQNADTVMIAGTVTGIDIGVVPISSTGMATLSGNVHSNGIPLAAANVEAFDAAGHVVGYAMSDAAGSYRINAAPAGQLRLVVDAQGYVGAQGNASIAPAQTSISAVDFSLIPAGSVTAVGNPDVPRDFALRQNYPNPFNPSTTIDYSLPVESIVHLTVYNLLGQEVATLMNGLVSVGKHQAVWNGKDNAGHQVASGIYFYRMNATPTAGGAAFSSIFKMVLLK